MNSRGRFLVRWIDVDVAFSEAMRGLADKGYPWETEGPWYFHTLREARKFMREKVVHPDTIWSDKWVLSRATPRGEKYIGSMYRSVRWRRAGA